MGECLVCLLLLLAGVESKVFMLAGQESLSYIAPRGVGMLTVHYYYHRPSLQCAALSIPLID